MTGICLIAANLLYPIRKLRSFSNGDMGIDVNPEDETSYTTQYQEAFLEYVENKYCAKHRQRSVTKPDTVPGSNLFLSAMACGFGLSSFDPYDLSSDDEKKFNV